MDQALELVLQKIKSGQQNLLKEAETQTAQWENENYPMYLYCLCIFICNPAKDIQGRVLAGVLFRGTIEAKDTKLLEVKHLRWLNSVPEELKANIKIGVLGLLASEDSKIRQIAAQVVSSIALVELPKNRWPELVNILLNNVTNPTIHSNIKQATLDTFGYILENISPDVLKSSADKILTAVVHGLRPDESNITVKRSACKALFNALDFCHDNFERQLERDVLMNVILEAAVCVDEEVRVSALGTLVEIAAIHYDKLPSYMQRIFRITLDSMKTTENIQKQAIEFWCTICEEELKLIEDIEATKESNAPMPSRSLFYAKGATPYIAPVLTELLVKTEADAEGSDWTVPMASGTCLNLLAQTVGDDVLQYVLPFVQRHIVSPDWRFKEASVLALGQILEGPKQHIAQVVTQVTPILLQHMKDPKTAVKDTTAYTIAKILKLHSEHIVPHQETILKAMGDALREKPRVATNAAWAIHNLAFSFKTSPQNPLKKYFREVVQSLLAASERPDADEENLRSSAYEALNIVLVTAPEGTEEPLEQLLRAVLERLGKSLEMGKVSQDDENKQNELQGLLCGVIQVIIGKIGKKSLLYADAIMTLILRLFKTKTNNNIHEEAFLTTAALSQIVEGEFGKYMNDFKECLYHGLSNWQDYQVCNVAVGLVGDIARALGPCLRPYCDKIVELLLNNLRNRDLDRSVKPPILSTFGDIALAIGGGFDTYLDQVMGMLAQASGTVIQTKVGDNEDQYDLIEYINSLREGIFEAYTGILQALKQDGKGERITNHVNSILQLIYNVSSDNRRSTDVAVAAVGICGDLAATLGQRVKGMLQQSFVTQLIASTKADCDSSEIKDTCDWARQQIQNL